VGSSFQRELYPLTVFERPGKREVGLHYPLLLGAYPTTVIPKKWKRRFGPSLLWLAASGPPPPPFTFVLSP
jgi:hypothetical protein